MLAAVFGDTHGHIEYMLQKAEAWEQRTGLTLDWVFQVGDFGAWVAREGIDEGTLSYAVRHEEDPIGDFRGYFLGDKVSKHKVLFIRGNHEDQEFLRTCEKRNIALHPEDYQSRLIEVCPNFFYLPDGHIVELGGVRIAGWGGCFGKKCWERKLTYWDVNRTGRLLRHMTQDVFWRLMESEFDILLTHEAPIGSGVVGNITAQKDILDPDELTEDAESGKGFKAIRQLIDTVQPRLQFNGHWHEFHRNKFGKTLAYVLDKVSPNYPDNHDFEVVEL